MKPSTTVSLALWLVFSGAHAQSLAPQVIDPSPATSPVMQAVAASNQDKDWQPSAAQQERVVRDALAYLAAKDEHRFLDAYARFAPAQKAAVPFEKWEADMRNFYGAAGAAEGRTLKKVTWYKNPANAPQGIFAAVDFSSQFSELSLHCGFVALQQQMDGSFRVAREEENSISKREMAKLTPEALRKIRAEYRC